MHRRWRDFVKVLDFGVAKIKTSGEKTLTKAGMIFGTPKYMSPEQARSQNLDARSDVYALGVMMYQMLMGRVPFDADDHVTILLKHVTEPPPPFAKVRPDLHVPPEFQTVVFRAMEKDVKNRYQSAEDMLMALEKLAMQLQIPLGTAAYPIMATGVHPQATATMPNNPQNPAPTPVPTAPPTTGEHTNTTGGVEAVPRTPTVVDSAPPTDEADKMDLGITMMPGARQTPFKEPEKSNTGMLIGVIAVLLVVIGAGVGAFLASSGGEEVNPKPEADLEKPQTNNLVEPPVKDTETNNGVAEDSAETNNAGGETNGGVAGMSNGAESGKESDEADGNDGKPALAKDNKKDKKEVKAPRDAGGNVTVSFTSTPAGASVFVNGSHEGVTPLKIKREKDKIGLLTAVFKLDGYNQVRKSVSLSRNQSIRAILLKKDTSVGKVKDPKRDPDGGNKVGNGGKKDDPPPENLYD